MTSTSPVEVIRVGRSFGDLSVLSDVDFTVGSGEIHGLIGPNGVGKTTLLRIVAGLVAPTTGKVRVMGRDPGTTEARRSIGWIPSGDRTFYLRLSGLENLMFFGRMYGLNRRRATERSHMLLESVGLNDAARRPSGVYSKGMLKRLGVARAMINEPQVLLCDETTHDLDPDGAESVRNLIRTLARGKTTTLWATQRLDELAGFADGVTVLTMGGVAFTGKMTDLIGRLPRRSFAIECGSSDPSEAADALDRVPNLVYHSDSDKLIITVTGATTIGEAITAIATKGIAVTSVSEVGSVVEDAYHHVLGAPDR